MRFLNHLLFSLLLSLVGLILFEPRLFFLYLPLGLFFGILPDIDESSSTIGKKAKPVGWFLRHRGLTHSLLPVLLLGCVLWLITQDRALVYMVVIPYLGHLFLDSMTKAGIMPVLPLSQAKIKGPFKTGSLFDRMLSALWLFADAFLIVWVLQLFLR